MVHPEEYEAQTPRCVFRMTDEHTQYPVLDWEEWQTNVLTSFLLLPKELVYRHMANVGLKDGISVLNRIYARKDYERFSEAAKRLGVSKTALTIRLSQLGLVGRNDLYDPYEQTFLKEKRSVILTNNNEQAKANQRIIDAAQTLENASLHITEWDESAVRQLVETVKVLSKDEIAVTLKGGIEICQKIMY